MSHKFHNCHTLFGTASLLKFKGEQKRAEEEVNEEILKGEFSRITSLKFGVRGYKFMMPSVGNESVVKSKTN